MINIKMTEIKQFVFLVFLFSLIISCRKDKTPESDLDYCELNPDECVDIREVKNWFYFDFGSYWVYEEENTGKRDSLYVIETYSDTGSHKFTTRLQSSYDGYDYVYRTETALTTFKNHMVKKSDKSTGVYRVKTRPGDFVASDRCFLFYPKVGMWGFNYGGIGTTNDTIIIEAIYDDYLVSDEFFSNVVAIRERYTAIEELQPTWHYFAEGVGLIKKELLDSNQVWNLVDYHIEY